MTKAFLAAYPWDLLDDVDATLDRLRGEVGLTGVAVWMAARPVLTLRARKTEPRVFRTRGGLLFQPSPEHFEGTRIKPIISEWARGRTVLPRIAEACAARGLELRVIVSASATGRLAERHPEAACKSLFGMVSNHSLCLANTDAQAFVCGLVMDLCSREGIAGVVVEDLCVVWSEALSDGLETAVPLSGAPRRHLGMCFCESCYQKATGAEVDAAAARRAAQATVNELMETEDVRAEQSDLSLEDPPILASYRRMQARELSRLVARLAESCDGKLILERSLDDPMRSQQGEIDWHLPTASLTHLNRDTPLPAALSGAGGRRELCLPASWAVGSDAQELVRKVAQAVEAGCDGVQFDHLGLLPDGSLNTLRQAVRFARRSAGG